MSLYLAIFDGDDELVGWVMGHYSDYGAFRGKVQELAGSHYPILLGSSDCDTTWTPADAVLLQTELRGIREVLGKHPPITLGGSFEHTAQYRAGAKSAADCFHNVDGENLFDALDGLCAKSIESNLNIVFQ